MNVTDQLSERSTEEYEQRFRNVVEQSMMGVAILRGREMKVELANQRIKEIWGKGNNVTGRTILDIFPEIKDQPFPQLLQEVYSTGRPFYGNEIKAVLYRNGKLEDAYFNFVYQPYFEFNNSISGVTVFVTEVTDAVIAKKRIEESEKQFKSVLLESPSIFAILRGYHEMIITFGNDPLFKSWEKTADEVIGKPLLEILPELKDQPFPKLLQRVYNTGRACYGSEEKAVLVKAGKRKDVYYNYVYQPIFDEHHAVSGITIMANDVTSQVVARKLVEEQNKILEKITGDSSLSDALEFLLLSLERQSNNGMMGSILLADENEKHLLHGAAPSLPKEYNAAINGIEIGPTTGSCGTAAYTKLPVIVSDIATDPLWKDFKTLALKHNLRACWSTPIMSGQKLLGTFAMYYHEAHFPTDEDKRIIQFALRTATLIIERKQAEEALRKREAQYRALVMATSDVIYQMNSDWTELRNLDGRNFSSESGMPVKDWLQKFIHPNDQSRVLEAVHEAIKTKSVFQLEHQVLHDDGTVGWIFSRAIPILDKDGEVIEWFGAASDVTERKHAEEALKDLTLQLEKRVQERTQELQRSNNDLQQFAHVASHDLKEPVRKIKTFGQRLQHEFQDSDEVSRGYLKKILNSADRMSTMIEGVLTYSTINASERKIEKLDLNQTLADIKDDLEILIDKKQAEVIHNELPQIEGVQVLIYQLFYNLIYNALKFSKSDVKPLIKITSSTVLVDDIEHAQIVISDNGIGFEPDYNEKIFDTFARLNPKDLYDGTGLGLSLCRKIVERHHGTIEANGQKDIGATFTIVLPYRQVIL